MTNKKPRKRPYVSIGAVLSILITLLLVPVMTQDAPYPRAIDAARMVVSERAD